MSFSENINNKNILLCKNQASQNKRDPYKISKLMYIIEAALEYFISIAVGSVYLARITEYIGISDTVTGILSSFVSLGCGFQIISIFLSNKRPVKSWVTPLHLISQLAFSFIYVVPLVKLSQKEKTVIFIVLLLSAQIIHNIVNSPKISWFMDLIEDSKRGKFTSLKEIVSLLSGMFFSFGMGTLMDHYFGIGKVEVAFTFCAIGLFALTFFHTLTLVFSKEKTISVNEKINTKDQLKSLLSDRTLLKVILIFIMWKIAYSATVPFTATYQARELRFSATFSSAIIIVGCLIRAIVSIPMGKYADRFGFARMLIFAYSVAALGFFVNIFTTPTTGKALYPLYEILNHISAAGINSATINLIYDYVDKDKCASAMALQNTFGGVIGFLATLICSPLVNFLQLNGYKILGFTVYAQQIFSCISFIIVLGLIFYIKKVIFKLRRVSKNKPAKNEL